MPEFIDPAFTKTSPKRSFSLNRKRAFWLVFAKTGSIISGTVLIHTGKFGSVQKEGERGNWGLGRVLTINVPLFKKLRDIIFFCGTLKFIKLLSHKKNYVPKFLKQR